MTDLGPSCDVCGGRKDVQRWTLRPEGKPPRTRWLCRVCARAVQIAYDLTNPARGADIIAERMRLRNKPDA